MALLPWPHVHMWFSKLAQVAYARARFDEAHTDELMAAIDRQFADASKPVIASWDPYVLHGANVLSERRSTQ